MSYELLHFRESEEILKDINMLEDIQSTIEYIDNVVYGSFQFSDLLKQALKEMGWRENGSLTIFEGRRYQYKGFKKGVAIEGNLSYYEYIQEGLFRLQIGYDKKLIETGVILLNSLRGEKTPYGSTRELVESEVAMLEPTVNLPVSVALFDVI